MAEEKPLLGARAAYDMAAKHYESWRWFAFWRDNEAPIVRDWLQRQQGIGLDAGCGTAPYLSEKSTKASTRIFLDVSEEMLKLARKKIVKADSDNAVFVQADICRVPIISSAIDFLLCTRVLSHASDFRQVIAEFSRTLRRHGEVLITDIHPEHPYQYTRIETVEGPIYVETYKHSISELIASANGLGLTLLEIQTYDLLGLPKPPNKEAFRKLYASPHLPIFYSLRLAKN